MSLSVCFLTRNEQGQIGRAVRSVVGLADQILVVDTHSTDGTAKEAQEAGAEVRLYDWCEDFGAGRNHVIAQAKGDWIFWIHADEELLPASHPLVRQVMTQDQLFGCFVRLQNVRAAERLDVFTETADIRLFRRRPDLRFIGRAHPSFELGFAERIQSEGLRVVMTDITLRKHAYLADRDEGKLRWTARLLELELQDRPGQLHFLIELGRTLLLLNDPRGQQFMTEAASQLLPQRQALTAPTRSVQVLLFNLLTLKPEENQTGLSADEARELALRWFPHSPRILWLIAQQAFNRRDFRPAAKILEHLVHLGKTRTYDLSQTFDPTMVGEQALLNLGVCLGELGEFDRAEQCFLPLQSSESCRAEAQKNLARVGVLRRQRNQFNFSVSAET